MDVNKPTLKDNILSSNLLILDIDDTEGSPEQLSIFLKKKNITHLIVHSFSRKNNYNSFRVIIPMDEAANKNNYKQILNNLELDINATYPYQYPIDYNCRNITKWFFLPSRSHFECDIFIDGTVKVNEFVDMPKFLSVSRELSRNIKVSTKITKPKQFTGSPNTQCADDILNYWAVSPGQGKGNQNFFLAGRHLKNAGYSEEDIRFLLESNKSMFGNGNDRDTSSVIKTLFYK